MRIVTFLILALGAVSATAQYPDKPIKFQTLDDYERCARDYTYNANVCMDPLKAFAKKNPKAQFDIGKRVRLHNTHWVALQFFEPALGKKPKPEQCADEDVGLAVVSGLALPPDYPAFAIAKRLYGGPCQSALQARVDKELTDANGAGYFFTNMCSIYQEAKKTVAACAPKVETPAAPVPEEKLPNIATKDMQIGLIKVYAGPEGESVTIGEVKNHAGYVLVRIDGVRGDKNGQVMLHKEDLQGERVTYWTELSGKRWYTVQGQKTAYGTDLRFYVPGTNTELAIRYSEEKSKAAKADMLLK
jgi:hypothetical protein